MVIGLLISVFGFVQFAHAQVCTPAPVGLVSWFQADGNALDSRSRNNGILQNGATFAAGQVGQAFSFDGIGSQIVVADAANLSPQIPANGELTVSAWVNLGALPSTLSATVLSKGSGDANAGAFEYELGISPSGQVFFVFQNFRGGGVSVAIGTPSGGFTLNQWHLVTGTLKRDLFTRIYVDGNLLNESNSFDFSLGPRDTTAPILIGRRSDGRPLTGLVDEVQIYSRALSTQEIQAILNAGTAGECKPTATVAPSGLVAWLAGDGNPNDISGNGNDGTLQSGAGFTVGRVGQSFSFDGVNAFVQLPNSAALNPSSITVESWINPQPVLLGTIIASRDPSASEGFTVAVGTDGSLAVNIRVVGNPNASPSFVSSAPNIIQFGQFQHIAVTYDENGGGALTAYVNGVIVPLSGTVMLGGAIRPASSHFIGQRQTGGSEPRNYQGMIDELSIYNRALTQVEVTSIFNAGLAGKLKTVTTPTGFAALSAPSAAADGLTPPILDTAPSESITKNSSVSISKLRSDTIGGTDLTPQVVNTIVGDATITFPAVTTAGTTQEIPLDVALFPAVPIGTSVGLTYDIATSSVFTGNPTICFNLPAFTPSQFPNLRILHFESGVWVNRTAASNTLPTLCTQPLASLSPFTIVLTAPSASAVSVGGRVSAAGQGLRNAVVVLTDPQGVSHRALTSSFGYYRFDEVQAGETYVISVSSKRYQFATRVVGVSNDLTDVDFTAIGLQ